MIVLYGSEGCSACNQARQLLDNKHILYEYVDANEIGYEGTIPVIFVNNMSIVGLGAINNYIKTSTANVSYKI